ncbi:hypothetical protein pRL70055 (plasmid) [Rhizobium johnstonii 3841]|uniref:Uncharacterized protein n=1 Tax=Rhizobium johnstonii (strain DSM 114642 / LMG 32736 / 3841) TaxID=216596 RepID=Q1M9W2_RHIJ3|nr:hypothetical protein pRL70055 [Rhizobium johnstonii 3841]
MTFYCTEEATMATVVHYKLFPITKSYLSAYIILASSTAELLAIS